MKQHKNKNKKMASVTVSKLSKMYKEYAEASRDYVDSCYRSQESRVRTRNYYQDKDNKGKGLPPACEEYVTKNEKEEAEKVTSMYYSDKSLKCVSITKSVDEDASGLMVQIAVNMASHKFFDNTLQSILSTFFSKI